MTNHTHKLVNDLFFGKSTDVYFLQSIVGSEVNTVFG